MECLQRLHEAVAKRMDDLIEATVLEYGAPQDRAKGSNNLAANIFLHFKEVLSSFDLVSHRDLADHSVVGRIHQVNELGSMKSDELAVDVGAIERSNRIRRCMSVHLCSPRYAVQPSVPAIAAPHRIAAITPF